MTIIEAIKSIDITTGQTITAQLRDEDVFIKALLINGVWCIHAEDHFGDWIDIPMDLGDMAAANLISMNLVRES